MTFFSRNAASKSLALQVQKATNLRQRKLKLQLQLDCQTANQISAAVSSIPVDIEDLDLSNNISKSPDLYLPSIVKAIKRHITGLSLASSGLSQNNATRVLSALPRHLRRLDLGKNHLGGNTFVNQIQALPPSLETLSLAYNSLKGTTSGELAKALLALPAPLKHLDLSHISCFRTLVKEIALVINAIPKKLISLNLSYIFPSPDNGDSNPYLLKVLNGLSTELNELNLAGNFLGRLEKKLVVGALEEWAYSQPQIRTLGLRKNELGNFASKDLSEILTALPECISSLDLGNNALGNYSCKDLSEILAALPERISCLDLGYNDLFKSFVHTEAFLRAIPTQVTSLNLAGNDFAIFTAAEVLKFLAAIPPHVTRLDLSNTLLGRVLKQDAVSLEKLFLAVPPHITHLNLGSNKLSEPWGSALTHLSQKLQHLDLHDNHIDTLVIDDFLNTFKCISDTNDLQSINLGDNDRDTQRPIVVQDFLAQKLAHKKFKLLGNSPPPFLPSPAPAIQPDMMMAFLTHPATTAMAALLLIGGVGCLAAVGAGLAVFEVGLIGAVSTVVGTALLVAGFFSSVESNAPVESEREHVMTELYLP